MAVEGERIVAVTAYDEPPAAVADRRPGRRRGAAARPGRHPRARQRAGAHRVGGLRDRDPGGRGRRRHHDRRHAAQLDPADHHGRRRWRPSARWPRGRCGSTSASGAARCPATSPTSSRCTTPACSASSASCSTPGSRSSATSSRRTFALAMKETARLGALMIVHAEDGHLLDEGALDGGQLRRVPGVPARRCRGVGDRPGHRAGRVDRRPGPRRPPELRRRRAGAARGPRGRRRRERRDLPALPDLRRRAHPDGATELKCCPPIREADNREALWAALAAGDIDFVVSDHSPCTASLKQRGGGDFGAGLGRHRVGPARAARRVDRRPGARALPGRRGALDGERALPTGSGWRTRAGSRSARTPTWSGSPPTRSSPSTWPGCTTATRSRPTPAAGSPAWCGRPGCAAYPSSEDAVRGRLLRRGER